MSATAFAGLGLGGLFALSVVLLLAVLSGWSPHGAGRRLAGRVLAVDASRSRFAIAGGGAVAVLIATRWPVASASTAGLLYAWPSLFGSGVDANGQVARLAALATWTEMLRDSVAGAVGLEDAIRHSVSAAPEELTADLHRLDGRLRAQVPITQALASLADDLTDASADLVIAALVLNSRLRGPGLVATLSALASSTREELDLRRRVEESRKSLRRTAITIVAATAAFALGLAVLSRQYVAPYSDPFGQLVLALVLAVFGVGLMWIRRATLLPVPPRFLSGGPL